MDDDTVSIDAVSVERTTMQMVGSLAEFERATIHRWAVAGIIAVQGGGRVDDQQLKLNAAGQRKVGQLIVAAHQTSTR